MMCFGITGKYVIGVEALMEFAIRYSLFLFIASSPPNSNWESRNTNERAFIRYVP
jgi:hypothetical protein